MDSDPDPGAPKTYGSTDPDSDLTDPDSDLTNLDSDLTDPDSDLTDPDSDLTDPDSDLTDPDPDPQTGFYQKICHEPLEIYGFPL
jgi:hypothetical protein